MKIMSQKYFVILLVIIFSSNPSINFETIIPLLFIAVKAPISLDPPIDVDTFDTFRCPVIFDIFEEVTPGGLIKKLSFA